MLTNRLASTSESTSFDTTLRQLAERGFALVPEVLSSAECAEIAEAFALQSIDSAGSRCLLTQPWCQALAGRLRSHRQLAGLIPSDFVATQCTYFEKTAASNWLVPAHQDLSIPVAARVEEPSLGGWSVKEAVLFVQAPVELLQQLLALRVHLDPCTSEDGPLVVVPGTHAQGRISAEAADLARRSTATIECELQRGDAMLMRPLLVHASSKAKGSSRRRVLHFLFGPRELPHGLRWHHSV